jgi:hypothetical protein
VPVWSHSEGLTKALPLQALIGKDRDAFATVGCNALNRHSSEKQGAATLAAGHRMITYYRLGFGALEPTERGIRIRNAGHRSSCPAQQARLRGWYWWGPVR